MGLQDGPIGLGAQKALISMVIINILGRDTDFSKIVAGALCLGMPMGADCTLTTLRYSILRATNPQMPVNRVFCAPRRTVRGTQNRGVAPQAPWTRSCGGATLSGAWAGVRRCGMMPHTAVGEPGGGRNRGFGMGLAARGRFPPPNIIKINRI